MTYPSKGNFGWMAGRGSGVGVAVRVGVRGRVDIVGRGEGVGKGGRVLVVVTGIGTEVSDTFAGIGNDVEESIVVGSQATRKATRTKK
jgi:hypothetical protein